MSIPEKPTIEMTLLQNQEQFEVLLGRVPTDHPVPSFVIVYFTAPWCKACKRLDLQQIVDTASSATWFKCDIDANDYTAGYCGIKSIPSFLVLKDKKVAGQLQDSRTEKVVDWLKRFVE